MRLPAGYHDNISMRDYLADPCEEPSLTTSVVSDLLDLSPLHAHLNHPRFGGKIEDSTPGQDLGSASHALALGGSEIVYCDTLDPRGDVALNWKTDAAKKFAADATARGQIPLLAKDKMRVTSAATAVRGALASEFTGLKTEQTMIWQSEGVWCKGRADAIGEHKKFGPADIDLKMVECCAPGKWTRQNILTAHYDWQMGLRSLGHKVLGVPRVMLWLCVEWEPPYDWSIVGMDPAAIAETEEECKEAARIWGQCLKTYHFPGVNKDVHWWTRPPWKSAEFVERKGLANG